MIRLYHAGPGANSLRALLCFNEKGVPFESRYIDFGKFEQHEDWFTKINPNGQVPVIDHDGKVINESTVIGEYLEDAVPDSKPLRPKDPYLAAQMRIWTKWVDEYFCWALSTLGWHYRVGRMVKNMADDEFEKTVARIPLREQQIKWRKAREGFDEAELEENRRRLAYSAKKIEDHLCTHKWLAGDNFTFADIHVFSIAVATPRTAPESMNDKDTPATFEWLDRICERPAVKETYAMAKVGPGKPPQYRGITELVI